MRLEKKAIVEEIKGQLSGAEYVILADCRGMTVEQMSELRAQLKGANAMLKVVPNALFGIAARESGWGGMDALLIGPTAMVAGRGEVTQTARLLRTYVKSVNLPVIKGGRLGTRILRAGDVDAMALLPSREVLLGLVVGTIAAPMTRLVGAMSQKLSTVVYALKAVADKKSGGN